MNKNVIEGIQSGLSVWAKVLKNEVTERNNTK